MYKLCADLKEIEREIKELFNCGFINAGTYVSLLEEARRKEQVGALEYEVTDEELNEYWS